MLLDVYQSDIEIAVGIVIAIIEVPKGVKRYPLSPLEWSVASTNSVPIKKPMRMKTLAAASALAAFTTIFPSSAEADDYAFWYAYQGGALAMLCDLHMKGIISTNTVQSAAEGLTSPDPDIPAASTRDAIKSIQEMGTFDDCPLPRP